MSHRKVRYYCLKACFEVFLRLLSEQLFAERKESLSAYDVYFRVGPVKMLRRIKTAVSDFRCRSDADVLERGKVVSGLRKK